ncbi:hypothetical protein GQ55_5G481000 [Panicum hallii var. hallii]|uniref:Uncharacterized protein n=1 Tax=Panicum hallii var. hallii TaxID=1504633 RepID=A0A2T7DR82_9POAL|nr:hypothetical protein GQ55_5G481000 [Panicum hallii var. hallii]
MSVPFRSFFPPTPLSLTPPTRHGPPAAAPLHLLPSSPRRRPFQTPPAPVPTSSGAPLQLLRRPSPTPPSPPRPWLPPHLDIQPNELEQDGEATAVGSDSGSARSGFGALALLCVAAHFQGASCRGGGGGGGRGGVRGLREGRRRREVRSVAWRRLVGPRRGGHVAAGGSSASSTSSSTTSPSPTSPTGREDR